MFTLKWTEQGAHDYGTLKSKAEASLRSRQQKGRKKASPDEGLFKQVYKAIRLLAANPRHPGLHTHEYLSLDHPYEKGQKVFGAYAQNNTPGAYRIFWCYGPGKRDLTILAITPHP
jgi:hypothetical protein